MPSLRFLETRDNEHDQQNDSGSMSPLMFNLIMSLLGLVFVGLLCVAALYFLRRSRRQQKQRDASQLPMYHPNAPQEAYMGQRRASNHRRLTITATPASFLPEYAQAGSRSSMYTYDEKKSLYSPASSPPSSPIPEIRVTFPEEVDESGRRLSGRVVVVRVGEQSVGLEPLPEDLPPYERMEGEGGFHTLDLEKMGGLKEKEVVVVDEKRWS